jgi:hypothetical protein
MTPDMDKQILLLGKLLGEQYRTQKKLGLNVPASRGQIYGLINGFEWAIRQELDGMGDITDAKIQAVADVLDEYFMDDAKLASFKGFYDIEHRLQQMGVDRGDAMQIIRYFNADGKFNRVIAKMDSSDSPSECRTFELYDWEDVE